MIRNCSQHRYEVMTMEEIDVRQRSSSRASPEFTRIGEAFGGEQRRYECYERCMNDPWDLSRDSMCLSACDL